MSGCLCLWDVVVMGTIRIFAALQSFESRITSKQIVAVLFINMY